MTAALVVEAIAATTASLDVATRMLVAPAVLMPAAPIPDHVALVAAPLTDIPVRDGATADLMLVLDGDVVRVATPMGREVVDSEFGRFARLDLRFDDVLAPGSADTLRRWWQVAIAAEVAGAATSAVRLTTEHLKERIAFGRPLAAQQALQHRLAELHVSVESVSWLARAAAWHQAQAQRAAAAAALATNVAATVATDTLQLCGAIGYTMEFDLHHWIGKLHVARTHLGGRDAHARSLAAARWAAG